MSSRQARLIETWLECLVAADLLARPNAIPHTGAGAEILIALLDTAVLAHCARSSD